MGSEFYTLYKSYEKQELFEVLLNPGDYQPEAIECAVQVLVEKKWADEYEKIANEKKAGEEKKAEEEQEDNIEKAEYYRKAVAIKMQHHGYSVLLGDALRFEDKLAEHNVEYFKEDKTLSRLPSNPDYETYYVKSEDIKTVDAIGKETGIFSAAFDSTQSQQVFPLKLTAIIVIGFIIIYGIYLLLSKK